MTNRWCFSIGIVCLLLAFVRCDVAPTAKITEPIANTSDTAKEINLPLPGMLSTLKHYNLGGSIHLFDEENNIYYHTDSAGFYKKNVPASTFKIFSSLIALEKGLLKDQHEVKAWKNRVQKNDDWNKDQDLKEAFAQSTNWFFEDITTALGQDTINAWLKRIGYPVLIQQTQAKFWLDDHFTISPQEQLVLMQKLQHRTLPFSMRTFDITQDIMLRKDTLGIKIYGKTGWGTPQAINVGWYIGWASYENRKPIYFATCIEQAEPASDQFDGWRKSLTEMALIEAFPRTWNKSYPSEIK